MGFILGDFVFIVYSVDEDDFVFVFFKDVGVGISIKFIDRGWLVVGGFRGGEGIIIVEFCCFYSCGDEFNIFNLFYEIKDVSGWFVGIVIGVVL